MHVLHAQIYIYICICIYTEWVLRWELYFHSYSSRNGHMHSEVTVCVIPLTEGRRECATCVAVGGEKICKDGHSIYIQYNTTHMLHTPYTCLNQCKCKWVSSSSTKNQKQKKHYNQFPTRCTPPHIYWWKCAYPPTNRRLDFHIAVTNAPDKHAASRSCCKPVLTSVAMAVAGSEDAVPEA